MEQRSILLPAENNLGICLSLSQHLQLPLSLIDMFGNCSRQMQHLSNCRAARLSWKPLILAPWISSGLSNRGNLGGCAGWRWLDKSSVITCLWWWWWQIPSFFTAGWLAFAPQCAYAASTHVAFLISLLLLCFSVPLLPIMLGCLLHCKRCCLLCSWSIGMHTYHRLLRVMYHSTNHI